MWLFMLIKCHRPLFISQFTRNLKRFSSVSWISCYENPLIEQNWPFKSLKRWSVLLNNHIKIRWLSKVNWPRFPDRWLERRTLRHWREYGTLLPEKIPLFQRMRNQMQKFYIIIRKRIWRRLFSKLYLKTLPKS